MRRIRCARRRGLSALSALPPAQKRTMSSPLGRPHRFTHETDCEGWFHHPDGSSAAERHKAGKAMIDRPEGTEAGVSGAPGRSVFFVVPLIRAHLFTAGRRAAAWPAAILRPSGGKRGYTPCRRGSEGNASVACPPGNGAGTVRPSFPSPVYTPDANSGLCIGCSRRRSPGLGGFGRRQASQGIYLRIACHRSHCL